MLSNYFLIATEIKKITWLLFIPKLFPKSIIYDR